MNMKSFRKGATFIEYAMLAGLVAVVVSLAALFFGDKLKGLFQQEGTRTKEVAEAVQKANITPTVTPVGPAPKQQ